MKVLLVCGNQRSEVISMKVLLVCGNQRSEVISMKVLLVRGNYRPVPEESSVKVVLVCGDIVVSVCKLYVCPWFSLAGPLVSVIYRTSCRRRCIHIDSPLDSA